MCIVASLDVDGIVQSRRLGLGKNLGQLQYDFNHFLKVHRECINFGDFLVIIWAMIGPGVPNVRRGLDVDDIG